MTSGIEKSKELFFSQVLDILKVFKGLKWIGHRPLEGRVRERKWIQRMPDTGRRAILSEAVPSQLSSQFHPQCFQVPVLNQVWETSFPKSPFYILDHFILNGTFSERNPKACRGRLASSEQIWDLTVEVGAAKVGKVKWGTKPHFLGISSRSQKIVRERILPIVQNLSAPPNKAMTSSAIRASPLSTDSLSCIISIYYVL